MRRAIVLLASIVIAIAAIIGWNWLRDNRMSNFNSGAEIYVRPGDSADDVLSILGSKAVSRKSLQRMFVSKKVSEYLKPGHYVIAKGATSVYVARMLNNGWQTPVRLTLSGTMRAKGDIARKIAMQMLVDSAEMHKALNDADVLNKFGFKPKNAFSLIIPDTYEIYWDSTPEEILACQKRAYDAFWTDSNIAKAKALGLTKLQVSILASIVKGESNYEPEFPKIAGVYLNRLKTGMKLQADPTVAYCYDYKLNRILKKHLEFESPYNTYKYAGLPPGPICVPTKECLSAVLNADYGNGVKTPGGKGCNLYFCANADFSGTHSFAKDLAGHNANAKAFQRELTRRQAAKKKQ